MRSPQLANYYLQSMGIQPWRRRQSPQVSCSWQMVSGVVITFYAYIGGVSSAAQQQLWNNLCDIFRYANVIDSPATRGVEIAFGQQSVRAESSQDIVVMYSLAELIAQPQLKVEVWDVIKRKIDC